MTVPFLRLRGTDQTLARVQDNIGAALDPLVAKLLQSTTWQPLTLVNGWVPYDVTQFTTPQYRVDMEGFVHIRGLIKNGTISGTVPVATFPVALAPTRINIFAVASIDLFGEVRVDTAGKIYAPVGNNGWVSLDNISFQAAG